jgi:hypothetical protein
MERRAFLKILATVPVAALALKFPNATPADKIAAIYRQHLGREASREEILAWIGDHNWAASVVIDSAEARYKDITPLGFD